MREKGLSILGYGVSGSMRVCIVTLVLNPLV